MTSESGEAAIQGLQDDIKDCKAILTCDVCFNRTKEVVISKCFSPLLQSVHPKSNFPSCERVLRRSSSSSSTVTTLPSINASLIDNPVMWAGRLCVYYALLKAGLVGFSATPLISEGSNTDLGFSKWFEGLQGRSEEKEATNRRKLVKNWHPTTKGTLKRSYRVTSKSVGQRLLKAIAALLSDDDVFLDAASHKGCQIRRESAHGESVCCNNVRALFDELPTPHLVLEITAFPAGPLTEKDYAKAEKLEKVLRSGA